MRAFSDRSYSGKIAQTETELKWRCWLQAQRDLLGSHLCERLIDDGLNVIGRDNFDDFYNPTIKRSNISESLSSGRFELVEGDIRDARCVEETKN